MLIGIFDSGIGGITVMYEALKALPKADYLYYADTVNVPYGSKSKEDVRKFVSDAAEFIVQKGVDAMVVACNTATSVAIDDLRTKYSIPIIGMEPAVKQAVDHNGYKRILVTATELTLKEEKLKNLISKLHGDSIVDLLPLPELVLLAENYEFSEQAVLPYLRGMLSTYDLSQFAAVVLGCTHFIYFKDSFKKLLPEHIELIDGNNGTVNNLKRTLEQMNADMNGSAKITFYNSAIEVRDNDLLQKYQNLFTRLDELS